MLPSQREVDQPRRKRGKDRNHTSNPKRLSIQEQQEKVTQAQEEHLSALAKRVGTAKAILEGIRVKDCILETEAETTQNMTLLFIYKMYCRLEKEIGALHSTPNLLPYNVMVERMVEAKKIMKDNRRNKTEKTEYDRDGTIYLTYMAISNIKKRIGFLSAIAAAKTKEAIKMLTYYKKDLWKGCEIYNEIKTSNPPDNPKSGILYWQEKRIDFVWECAKRLVKVGYFMEHKCTYSFLKKMSENPDELLTIFNEQEWEESLKEYETLLHQERFVQAAALNRAWQKREKATENTKPDIKLYERRALESLQCAGKEFFEMFEDVIDTRSIYDGSSKRGTKYGTNSIAYLCYVEVRQGKEEKRGVCWQACGLRPAFSEWKEIDMEVRDMPGLGKLRREIAAMRKELYSTESGGRRKSNNVAGDESSSAGIQPKVASNQPSQAQYNPVRYSQKRTPVTLLDAPEAIQTSEQTSISDPVPIDDSILVDDSIPIGNSIPVDNSVPIDAPIPIDKSIPIDTPTPTNNSIPTPELCLAQTSTPDLSSNNNHESPEELMAQKRKARKKERRNKANQRKRLKKLNKCPLCDKTFADFQARNRHLHEHPYVCPVPGYINRYMRQSETAQHKVSFYPALIRNQSRWPH